MAETSTAEQQPDESLSLRWFITAFLSIVVFICILLYGVYLPFMSHLSNESVAEGNAYRDRAMFLRSHRPTNIDDIEALNARIMNVFRAVDAFGVWARTPPPNSAPGLPINRNAVETLKAAESDIRSMNEFISAMVAKDDFSDTFKFLLDRFAKHALVVEARMDVTMDKPLTGEYYTEKYYSGLCYTDLPIFLTLLRQIYGLYNTEICFDNAMAEYIDAAAYYRLTPVPRLRMADLYRDREWPEFAMMEYLRVIKLDPAGDLAADAFNSLRDYVGKHPEAEFHLALGYMMYEDYETAGKLLQTFLENAPTNIRAPKASEVLRHLRAGNEIFLRQYIRDEIWI